jgi:hypothetical protein
MFYFQITYFFKYIEINLIILIKILIKINFYFESTKKIKTKEIRTEILYRKIMFLKIKLKKLI